MHSGLVMKSLETDDGRFTARQLADVVNPSADLHMAPTRLVCLENTHNGGGGRVWPLGRCARWLRRPGTTGSPSTWTARGS